VALFHISVFFALFVSPFIGGAIIDTIGYRAAFAISGTGRLVATALFFLAIVPAVRGGMRADD
jgi:dipeptide/tripeptide permease